MILIYSDCTRQEKAASSVKSLTALLMEQPTLHNILADGSELALWSPGHVLSAAKALQRRGGRLIALEPGIPHSLQNNPLVRCCPDLAHGEQVIQEPPVPPRAEEVSPVRSRPLPYGPIHPLTVPDSTVLFLDVYGSQPHIGCTTQALQLWHYAKLIGFDPVMVVPETQLEALKAVLEYTVAEQVTVFDGIPFCTDACHHFDCYIRDRGVAGSAALSREADVTLLIAGVKPWELASTVRAYTDLHPQALVLSYATQKAVQGLAQQLDGVMAAASNYIPDPWRRDAVTMRSFDRLLRSTLSQAMQPEKEEPLWKP